jgi:6-phosphogluconolactonase
MEIKKLRNKVLAVAGICALSSAAMADGRHIYAMSNSPSGNVVSVVQRGEGGSLTLVGTYPTGGIGSGVGLSVPPDPLGSQNSMVLSENNRWLFVANPASNQISVFRAYENTLVLASVAGSGGDYPVSLAMRGNVVYVLNARNQPSITGFRLTSSGKLIPIPGSTRQLATVSQSAGAQPHVLDSPAQVQFSPDGRWLVVNDKNLTGPGTLSLYAVSEDGRLGATAATTVSPDPAPFGYTFDARGHLLVTEAIGGAVSSYQINRDGSLTSISRVLTGQLAVCWIDIKGRFAYSSNTRSSTLTGYRVDRDGSLALLNADGITAAVGAGTAPVELRLSGDGEYLYTVAAGLGSIEAYRIDRRTGALTKSGELHLNPGFSGMVGLAVE